MNLLFRSTVLFERMPARPRIGFKLTLVLPLVLLAFSATSALAQTAITNGARTTATLTLNTTNVYTFSATNGESIQVRMGAPFRPLVAVYAPNGSLLGSGSGSGSSSLDGLVQITAAMAPIPTPARFHAALSMIFSLSRSVTHTTLPGAGALGERAPRARSTGTDVPGCGRACKENPGNWG